jgi:hypothetical protein
MALHKRYTTVAYDSSNLSILSAKSIGAPEPISATSVGEVAENLTRFFSHAFSPIPKTTNSNPSTNLYTAATTFCADWVLRSALRTHHDSHRDYGSNAHSLLQNFLAAPVQYSTAVWQAASFDTLPADLKTTASPSTSAYRAFGSTWTLVVFAVEAGLPILWALAVLAMLVLWCPEYPTGSKFPDIDIVAKCRASAGRTGKSPHLGVQIRDLESLAKQRGMGKETLGDVRVHFDGEKLYILRECRSRNMKRLNVSYYYFLRRGAN